LGFLLKSLTAPCSGRYIAKPFNRLSYHMYYLHTGVN
jgi:hypothetical protein